MTSGQRTTLEILIAFGGAATAIVALVFAIVVFDSKPPDLKKIANYCDSAFWDAPTLKSDCRQYAVEHSLEAALNPMLETCAKTWGGYNRDADRCAEEGRARARVLEDALRDVKNRQAFEKAIGGP